MPQKSKLQETVENQAINLFHIHDILKIEYDEYYDFLKNPKTNKPLQLDILFTFNKTIHKNKKQPFKQIRMAIEVQGKQHYHFVKEFHKRESQLNYQKYRDSIKLKSCFENGIILVPIKYTSVRKNFSLKEVLLSKLPTLKLRDPFFKSSREYIIELLKFQPYIPDLDRINSFCDFLKPRNDFEDNILDCI